MTIYVVDIIETIKKVPEQSEEADENGKSESEVGRCFKYMYSNHIMGLLRIVMH